MAAGDFTNSALQVAQVKLMEMFASPNISQTELSIGSAISARALLMKQRARTVPRLVGDKCVGVEAWYIRPHAEGTADTTAPSTCATPCGDEAETLKGTYDTEVLARSQAKVEDNRCDNLITFGEELAAQQQHMMAKMRQDLNKLIVITRVAAASQANLDEFIDATWDYTTNTPRIVVPETDFTYEKFNEFGIVASNNNFSDVVWLSGRLFNDQRWFAQINRNNEGFRDRAVAFDQQEMYFDVRDLDQTMTRKTAFAVDVNSYAFWNTVRNTPTPQQVNTDSGKKWVWVQADPILQWNNNGRLSPVLYEMEMAETCAGRDEQEFQQNQYCLYGRLLGGFKFAPTGPNSEKGVLQFATA
jgi:hypothetical protein